MPNQHLNMDGVQTARDALHRYFDRMEEVTDDLDDDLALACEALEQMFESVAPSVILAGQVQVDDRVYIALIQQPHEWHVVSRVLPNGGGGRSRLQLAYGPTIEVDPELQLTVIRGSDD